MHFIEAEVAIISHQEFQTFKHSLYFSRVNHIPVQLFFYLNAFKPSPKPDLTFVAGGPPYKSALEMILWG